MDVEYHGPVRKKHPLRSHYRLDLNIHVGTASPPKGLPELVNTMEKIRKEVDKWTDGARGVRVTLSAKARPKKLTTKEKVQSKVDFDDAVRRMAPDLEILGEHEEQVRSRSPRVWIERVLGVTRRQRVPRSRR